MLAHPCRGLYAQYIITKSFPFNQIQFSRARVGNFRKKNYSTEDGIVGENRNKLSEFHSEPFRGRGKNPKFRFVKQK
jgi:hypothetical protein